MKAYKIELLVIDFDGLGQQGVVETIESRRWPNDCISPSVEACQEADIGVWTDDHPLNRKDTAPAEYARIFPATSPAPAVVQMTDEKLLQEMDAIFHLMLKGCAYSSGSFIEWENGDGECIGPQIEELRAKIKAAMAAAAALAKQVLAQEQDKIDAQRYRFRKQFLAENGAILFSTNGCQFRKYGFLISSGKTEEEAIDAAVAAQLAQSADKAESDHG